MNDILRLLWTQSWQIAALAILVAIITRTVAKNRPHLAHAMWLLVLIKCVTPPIWGHSLGLFSRLQAAMAPEQIPAASDATYEYIPQAAEPTSSLVRHSLESERQIPGNMASDSNTAQVLPNTKPPLATVPAVDMSEVTATKSVEGVRGSSCSWPAILLFCVVAGAFVTLSLMIVRCVQCLRRIHRHRTAEFDDLLIARVQDLSHKLRVRRAPRVIVSDVLFGPAVLGLLRHTIVLPRCLIKAESGEGNADDAALVSDRLSALRCRLSSLDPILAHELLHIRRGDLRTGTLQAIVQSLWWFHPAVWFSNRWLSREAERCCDEQVIAELGCPPAQYARSLLSVIESKHRLQPIPVFPGMKPVEITTQRMERIMSLKTNLKKQTPLWCWLVVAALAIVVLPGAVAKPQSEENVVEAQPQEMALPQETKVANVAEVEVSTKTYIVGDLVERLAKEQNLSLDQARKSLLQIFESSVVPVHRHVQSSSATPAIKRQPSPPTTSFPGIISITGESSITWTARLSSYAFDDDRLVVVQSAEGHTMLQEHIDAVRKFGFTKLHLTARCITGPEAEIDALMASLNLEKPFAQRGKRSTIITTSKKADDSFVWPTVYASSGTNIVSHQQAIQIEEQTRARPDVFAIERPELQVCNSQTADIYVGETKPYITGFDENKQPVVRTIIEGLSLSVTPTVVEEGLLRFQSIATLEGASEIQPISVAGDVTRTPQTIRVPTINTQKVQTIVELRHDQALVQTGLTRTREGKVEAVLVILEAQPLSTAVQVESAAANHVQRTIVPVRYVSELCARIETERKINRDEAIFELKHMVDEAMNSEKPVSVDATTIVLDGDQLIIHHPGALENRLQMILEQIRKNGFAQSLISVSVAVVPEKDAIHLLQQYPMASAVTTAVDNFNFGRPRVLVSSLWSQPILFCKLNLVEAWDVRNRVLAIPDSEFFNCRRGLPVLNGELTSIKPYLNPAIGDIENELPGTLLDFKVKPLNLRLQKVDFNVFADDSCTTWACEVTDQQACLFRGAHMNPSNGTA